MKRLSWAVALSCSILSAPLAAGRAAGPAVLPKDHLPVPPVRQAASHTCGAAALLSVLFYWQVHDGNEGGLYEKLQTTEKDGTAPESIVAAARHFGLKARARGGMSLEDLRAALRARETVILALQAWRDESKAGRPWRDEWEDGHYVVLVGMDESHAYFMDPAVPAGYAYMPLGELEERWHDYEDRTGKPRRYLHYGITIAGKKPVGSAVGALLRLQ